MKVILFRSTDIDKIKTKVKDHFKTTQYGSYANYVKAKREDYRPIRIRDDNTGERYVLTMDIKSNPTFAKFKEIVEDATNNISVISVLKADLPEYYDDDTPTDYSKT